MCYRFRVSAERKPRLNSIQFKLLTCFFSEIGLLTTLLDDPGNYNVELDSGVNHRTDAFKFTTHVKKLPLPFEMSSAIITHMDATRFLDPRGESEDGSVQLWNRLLCEWKHKGSFAGHLGEEWRKSCAGIAVFAYKLVENRKS